MNLNIFIYLIGAISFLCIININFILIQFPSTYNEPINQILLNLSYGYITGLIIYILTVVIPFYKKRKLYLPILNKSINNLICVSNSHYNLIEFDTLWKELKNHSLYGTTISECGLDVWCIKQMQNEWDSFTNAIVLSEALSFLDNKQIGIINKLKEDDFLSAALKSLSSMQKNEITNNTQLQNHIIRLFEKHQDELKKLGASFNY